jgi:hypothetical protein
VVWVTSDHKAIDWSGNPDGDKWRPYVQSFAKKYASESLSRKPLSPASGGEGLSRHALRISVPLLLSGMPAAETQSSVSQPLPAIV